MLLALGPVQLDAAASVIVVGIAETGSLEELPRTLGSCDLLWLRGTVAPEHVSAARGLVDVPVGVDADDVGVLVELAAAGAVAVQFRSPSGADLGVALEQGLTLWCTTAEAQRAAAAGFESGRVVVEGGAGPGVPGFTGDGGGPEGWGAVFGAVVSGARVVRTNDVRSARRVVAVTERLLAARGRSGRVVTA